MDIPFSLIEQFPRSRLPKLEAANIAHFVQRETGLIRRAFDHIMAEAENRLIERNLVGRIRRALEFEPGSVQQAEYLEKMRTDYESGRKETLSLYSMTSLSGWETAMEPMTEEPEVNPETRRYKAKPTGVLFYVPGGGFLLPPSRKQLTMVEKLAGICGLVPYVPAHRLAPETPFPEPIYDIAEQYTALVDRGVSPSRIIVAADTAGASLLMGAIAHLRVQKQKLPSGILLFSPWCDLGMSGWSYITRSISAGSPFRMETAAFCARLYLQNANPLDPRASAVHMDMIDMPPMQIHTSEYDMHFDDAISLAENMKSANRECRLAYWNTPRHHMERLGTKDSEKSYALSAEFVRRVLN